MKVSLFPCCFFLVGVSIAAFGENSRPFSEMHGDCGNFRLNLTREFALWSGTVKKTAEIPIAERVLLPLEPQAKVHYTKEPERKFEGKGSKFGLVASFRVPKKGIYRLSFGRKVWSDVVDAEKKSFVEPREFEMQTGCGKIFKVVHYSLEADRRYELQLNGSTAANVDFLLTQAP